MACAEQLVAQHGALGSAAALAARATALVARADELDRRELIGGIPTAVRAVFRAAESAHGAALAAAGLRLLEACDLDDGNPLAEVAAHLAAESILWGCGCANAEAFALAAKAFSMVRAAVAI
ncbi:hypothetical protein ACLQ3C_09255 [Gordonia sp. DT30]|uniref:hypothetical protein n=1 Tax=Gordonia sp. DT30 TaxID=3416546 RepID=UPI003CF6A75F